MTAARGKLENVVRYIMETSTITKASVLLFGQLNNPSNYFVGVGKRCNVVGLEARNCDLFAGFSLNHVDAGLLDFGCNGEIMQTEQI